MTMYSILELFVLCWLFSISPLPSTARSILHCFLYPGVSLGIVSLGFPCLLASSWISQWKAWQVCEDRRRKKSRYISAAPSPLWVASSGSGCVTVWLRCLPCSSSLAPALLGPGNTAGGPQACG